MRPRIVIPVLAAALGALLILFLFAPKSGAPLTASLPQSATGLDSDNSKSDSQYSGGLAIRPPSRTFVPSPNQYPASVELSEADYVQARTSQLAELGMNDDSDSLQIILSELGSRNAEIRRAAREAAIQFGSDEVIPAIVNSAFETDDLQEKLDIQKAIEFLQLPSVLDEAKD